MSFSSLIKCFHNKHETNVQDIIEHEKFNQRRNGCFNWTIPTLCMGNGWKWFFNILWLFPSMNNWLFGVPGATLLVFNFEKCWLLRVASFWKIPPFTLAVHPASAMSTVRFGKVLPKSSSKASNELLDTILSSRIPWKTLKVHCQTLPNMGQYGMLSYPNSNLSESKKHIWKHPGTRSGPAKKNGGKQKSSKTMSSNQSHGNISKCCMHSYVQKDYINTCKLRWRYIEYTCHKCIYINNIHILHLYT